MTITKDTLLHLNQTIYFDDDGYEYNNRFDAVDNSVNADAINIIRKQNCYFYEYDELDKDNQELAQTLAYEAGCKPEELMYVVKAKNKNILMSAFWTDLQEEINDGIYTIVEQKEDN